MRLIGAHAFSGTGVREARFGTAVQVSSYAFWGCDLEEATGEIQVEDADVIGRPVCDIFANCRRLRRLELTRGFVPERFSEDEGRKWISRALAGHVPRKIRFHGGIGEARRLFRDVLASGGTMVIKTDLGRIRGGPRSTDAVRSGEFRVWTALTASVDPCDAIVRIMDLSATRKGALESGLKGWLWIEEVALPAWLEKLPEWFFHDCRSLKAVNTSECLHLREIGYACFACCESLRSLDFPETLRVVARLSEGVDWRGCTSIMSLGWS
jgi:hypothetical protein